VPFAVSEGVPWVYIAPKTAMRSSLPAAALLICASVSHSQTLTAAQAREHEGQNATVCGTVASERQASASKGKPTFVNLDVAYPDQIFTVVIWEIFTVVIWEEDLQKVGVLPRSGAHMCAKGVISYYHGVPEIIVRSNGQITP
jgi:hypothetical protein